MKDRRATHGNSLGRRKSDGLSGHISGLVNLERWQIIDRVLEEIGPEEDKAISEETWKLMGRRDRVQFAKNAPNGPDRWDPAPEPAQVEKVAA